MCVCSSWAFKTSSGGRKAPLSSSHGFFTQWHQGQLSVGLIKNVMVKSVFVMELTEVHNSLRLIRFSERGVCSQTSAREEMWSEILESPSIRWKRGTKLLSLFLKVLVLTVIVFLHSEPSGGSWMWSSKSSSWHVSFRISPIPQYTCTHLHEMNHLLLFQKILPELSYDRVGGCLSEVWRMRPVLHSFHILNKTFCPFGR